MNASRTDVLTVERQMLDFIEKRTDDPVFCWDLQLFLQDCGATFDLPISVSPYPDQKAISITDMSQRPRPALPFSKRARTPSGAGATLRVAPEAGEKLEEVSPRLGGKLIAFARKLARP